MKEWELRNEWKEMTRDRKYRSMFKKGGLDNNVGSTNINDKNGGKSLRKKRHLPYIPQKQSFNCTDSVQKEFLKHLKRSNDWNFE